MLFVRFYPGRRNSSDRLIEIDFAPRALSNSPVRVAVMMTNSSASEVLASRAHKCDLNAGKSVYGIAL